MSTGRWKCTGVARATPTLCLLLGCGVPELATESASRDTERWLFACASKDDCPASGACLHGLCTLACDQESLEICAGLSTDAVCDTDLGACDVPCGVAMACGVLGSGYACAADAQARESGHDKRCRAPRAEP